MSGRLARALGALLLLALTRAPLRAQEARIPEPTQRAVSDFAELLDEDSEAAIERRLRDYRDRSGNQLVLITVPVSWRGRETTESYSLRIAETWKIGTKGKDNGLIFLIIGTPQDRVGRDVRFEVGYGLEGDLPDAICKRIQLEQVVPRLKAGDYARAVNGGFNALIARLDHAVPPQEPPPSAPASESKATDYSNLIGFLVVMGGLLIVIWILRQIDFTSGGGTWTGGSRGWSRGWGYGGFGGFSGGGFSGGGGGFSGGFGGGGGSFGGGGASSGW